jgi:hypothetical protein
MHNLLKVSAVTLAMVTSGVAVSYAQQAEAPQADMQDIDDMADMASKGGEHHGGKHHGGKRHGRGEGMRGARMIDINQDGTVSEEEAAAIAEHLFMRMDEDRNEALSEAEFTTPPHGRRGWFNWGQEEAAAVTEVRKQKFAKLDADKNGSVSKAEFFADAKARLAAADTDKDGKVTPWEFRAAPKT